LAKPAISTTGVEEGEAPKPAIPITGKQAGEGESKPAISIARHQGRAMEKLLRKA
jgi:hypothetical protein